MYGDSSSYCREEHLESRGQGDAKHPMMHRLATQNKEFLAQMLCFQVEEPCSIQISLLNLCNKVTLINPNGVWLAYILLMGQSRD